MAPTEFLTKEHNTLSGQCSAKSKACPYSRDPIRTIKGFLFLKACLSFSKIHSPSFPLQQELYQRPSPFRGFVLLGMPFPLSLPANPSLGSKSWFKCSHLLGAFHSSPCRVRNKPLLSPHIYLHVRTPTHSQAMAHSLSSNF